MGPNEFLFKDIKRFFLACFLKAGVASEITLIFVANSFHKVAKIYPLLEFYRNGVSSPSPPAGKVYLPLAVPKATTRWGEWDSYWLLLHEPVQGFEQLLP